MAQDKLKETVKKYSEFVDYPIYVHMEVEKSRKVDMTEEEIEEEERKERKQARRAEKRQKQQAEEDRAKKEEERAAKIEERERKIEAGEELTEEDEIPEIEEPECAGTVDEEGNCITDDDLEDCDEDDDECLIRN